MAVHCDRFSSTRKIWKQSNQCFNGNPMKFSTVLNSAQTGISRRRMVLNTFSRTSSHSSITTNGALMSLVTGEFKFSFIAHANPDHIIIYRTQKRRYNRTLLERASIHFNLQNGGDIQYVSKVIFSDGHLNPYRSNGVAEYNPITSDLVITECKHDLKVFVYKMLKDTFLSLKY